MTLANVVLDATRSFPQGPFTSQVFAIPKAWKRQGFALAVMVEMEAENFPAGTTSMSINFSTDGGQTYRSASMTCDNPAIWRGSPPHFWRMTYSLDDGALPDHAFYTIDAPAAFSTRVIVSAE